MNKRDKQFVYSYERPSIATDVTAFGVRRLPAVQAQRDGEMQMMILLVHRSEKSKAFPGVWALPGGFFKPTDANIEYCARRELKEETNLSAKTLIPFGNFSAPKRDPRGWYTSIPYIAIVSARDMSQIKIKADTDVDSAEWFVIKYERKISTMRVFLSSDSGVKFEFDVMFESNGLAQPEVRTIFSGKKLAFDHGDIIATALLALGLPGKRMRSIAFLGEEFTLPELRYVYRFMMGVSDEIEAIASKPIKRTEEEQKIWDGLDSDTKERAKKIIPITFKRAAIHYLENTNRTVEGKRHRPAPLYRWKGDIPN